ncbi:MAG: hypothetical protein ACHQ5A_00090 [Opitutales bacterium]
MAKSRFFTAPTLAFICTVAVALAFALYTQHAWEDYYITYRSSKNLATGHGLVYNVGDRLHTFTSPLGVLLPALACLLTGNSSDAGALWIFRLMSITALAGGAALLVQFGRKRQFAQVAGLLLVAWFVTDAKILDFSINGMETAFMMLFLAYALWAQVSAGTRQWAHLGGAWAGLMWTRPDSFVYIGLVAAGFWLFNEPTQTGRTRAQLFQIYLRAGLLTSALYLPWLAFAQNYYGTFVPHTITAKSGIGDPRTIAGFFETMLKLPFTPGREGNTLSHTFLPAYFMIGGWPFAVIVLARALGILCAVLWLLPRLRLEVRAASFAFFGGQAYLSYFPYFPFPWYLPATTLLAFVVLSGLVNQLRMHRWPGRVAVGLAVGLVAGSAWTSWQAARELAAQQHYIETGNRQKIGLWLHAHAQPGQSVFMEPLGYIGYFSGLKTYDFPGMSSREMVQARQVVGNDWATLIEYLHPDWLVLRPPEIAQLDHRIPNLLHGDYQPAQDFSVADDVAKLDVFGRPYLQVDSHFTVFKSTHPNTFRTKMVEITSKFPISIQSIEGVRVTLVHAPGRMVAIVPAKATKVEVSYGFSPGAYAGPGEMTDGAYFQIEWEGDGRSETLLNVFVDPVAHPEQRRLLHFEGKLPASDHPARLVFRTLNGPTLTKDWTCWSTPQFQ